MSALDAWDLAVLTLALDFLSHHADAEIFNARIQRNTRKQIAMRAMRQQIVSVRAKLRAMQVPS